MSVSLPENAETHSVVKEECWNGHAPQCDATVKLDCTGKERVLFEVLNAVLSQSVLSAANESANEIFRVL